MTAAEECLAQSHVPFDTIVKKAGGSARYQFLVFILMSIALFFPGIMSAIPVFFAYKQDYRCAIPNDTMAVDIPGNGTLIQGHCFLYRNDSPQLKTPCNSWEFDTPVFTSTIRSRYNLVCGRAFLAEFSTTLFFLGYILGSVGYGLISDKFGRMVGILLSTIHLSGTAFGAAFAPTYWTFAAFRFLVGVGNGGLYATAFTMMAEVCDNKRRVVYCEIVHNGFSYGVCLLALIAYFQRDCVKMQIIAASTTLVMIIMPLLIPESPRWLHTTGRLKRAEKALAYVLRFNKDGRNNNLKMREEEEVAMKEEPTEVKQESILSVFRKRPLLLVILINWFSWFAASVGFYATIFTFGDIGGNIFLTVCIGSLIEVPGRIVAIIIARKRGRVAAIGGALVGGGLGCLINSFLITIASASTAVQVFSIINKFWMAMAFDTIWMYSGELFPTIIRNIGLGTGSMMARVGGMFAPQISLLFDVWRPLPLIIMGILPCLSGLLCFLLPETRNKDTLENINDMCEMVAESSRIGRKRRTNRAPMFENSDKEAKT